MEAANLVDCQGTLPHVGFDELARFPQARARELVFVTLLEVGFLFYC
jgi:hypothetical protein